MRKTDKTQFDDLKSCISKLNRCAEQGVEAVAITGKEAEALSIYIAGLNDALRDLETIKQYADLMKAAGSRVHTNLREIEGLIKITTG